MGNKSKRQSKVRIPSHDFHTMMTHAETHDRLFASGEATAPRPPAPSPPAPTSQQRCGQCCGVGGTASTLELHRALEFYQGSAGEWNQIIRDPQASAEADGTELPPQGAGSTSRNRPQKLDPVNNKNTTTRPEGPRGGPDPPPTNVSPDEILKIMVKEQEHHERQHKQMLAMVRHNIPILLSLFEWMLTRIVHPGPLARTAVRLCEAPDGGPDGDSDQDSGQQGPSAPSHSP
jgi:hypothetical protein